MLFFYGTGTSDIGRFPLLGVSCAYCRTPNSVAVALYSRYLHFFWIPLIPLGKRAVTACAHCQQVLPEASWPPAYRAAAQPIKDQARIPITNYLAISILGVLFVGFMALGAFFSATSPAHPASAAASGPAVPAALTNAFEVDPAINEAKLANPQTGDMYVVHNSGGGYTVMRVERVAPDTLYFKGSTYRPETPAVTSPDSVARHLNAYVSGIPRVGLGHLNETKMLTIVRR